jgi:hypothetical protein
MLRLHSCSGSVAIVRIAGVRVGAPSVVLLVQIVEDAGFRDTAARLANAMEMKALEPALTIEDHEAILAALGKYCPTGLARLRRELLEDKLRRGP